MNWNWTDVLILAIILVSGFIGLKKGFIHTVFKFLSFFVALFVSIKFSPLVSKWLTENTPLYDNIKKVVMPNVLRSLNAQGEAASEQAKEAAVDSVMNGLALPGGLKSVFMGRGGLDLGKLIDFRSIADAISGSITETIISILSMILLYFAIRVALYFLRFLMNGIAKLPVFSQINAVGGLSFGIIQGLFSVYLLCTVLYLLVLFNQFRWILQAVETSAVASYFYQNNFLLKFFVGG